MMSGLPGDIVVFSDYDAYMKLSANHERHMHTVLYLSRQGSMNVESQFNSRMFDSTHATLTNLVERDT